MKISVGPPNRELCLEFFKQADRYAHRIRCRTGGLDSVLLSSREGTPDDHWPIGPPCQQLTLEERSPVDTVALLVGMAGRSHWSISITPDHETVAFDFDVACRANLAPSWLGSSYAYEGELQKCDSKSIRIAKADHSGLRVISRQAATSIESVAGGLGFEIVPACQKHEPPQTFRWRYRIESCADGD